jgi:hypothetical protein
VSKTIQMRNRYLTLLFVVGLSATSRGQLYVTSGNTLTIQAGATVHSTGNVVNNGAVSGGGFLDLRSSATTYSGAGAISNLRVSGGANVTPANDVTIGNALDVASGSSLTIPANRYILVNGPLSNAGTFTVQNTGSLVQGTSSTLTNSGTFNVRRQGTDVFYVYNYWSSPISSGTVPGSNVYGWNPNTSTQSYADDTLDPGWIPFSGAMAVGRGYASTGGYLATFSGTVNNGVLPPVPLIYYNHSFSVAQGTPFNLVGNPYPSAISAHLFVAQNPDINGSLYFWDDDFTGGSGFSTTDYATWNYTGTLPGSSTPGGGGNSFGGQFAIGSCQGFMVRAITSVSPSISFNNGQRLTGPNDIFFRLESEPQRLYLSLESTEHFNQILIGLVEDATDGEDRLYDAVKIRGNSQIALAAENEGKDYSIMAFAPPSVEKTIPLNVFIAQSGTYNFHSNTIEGFAGYDIYLEDRSNLSYYPLNEGTQVPFNLNAGEIVDRFYLHIGPELVTDVNSAASNPSVRGWIFDGILNVTLHNVADAQRLELFDISGKVVWSSSSAVAVRLTVDVNHLSRGAYILRLTSDSGVFSEKVIR